MTHIYFIRHAKPNFNNHDDFSRELSEKGLSDRKLVTAFLADKSIDLVFSSPYKRAVDTVLDFADSYNYEVNIIEDFRERKVNNCWIEDFNSFCQKQWEDFDYKLTDGDVCVKIESHNLFENEKEVLFSKEQ